MRFAKGHGTENDFVILLDPDAAAELTPALVVALCDRRAGIGGDGVLRVVRTAALAEAGEVPGLAGAGQAPEWFMDYRNSDGSVAEMCGNGIRVFARYLARKRLVAEPEFEIATRAGFRRVVLDEDGGVTVDMGAAAVLGAGRAVVGGHLREGLRISVGNPHLACVVDADLADFDLTVAPEVDPAAFPDGANVELVRITGPASAAMRVYERGSGETRSCGTGSVAAVAAAAQAAGRGTGSWRLTVPGGELAVTLAEDTTWLTGPAVIVAEGELDPDWLASAAARALPRRADAGHSRMEAGRPGPGGRADEALASPAGRGGSRGRVHPGIVSLGACRSAR